MGTPEEKVDNELFGKIWSYEELLLHKPAEKTKPDPGQPPAHWPDNVAVDPGKWVFWLPDDWGQGIKTTINGKPLRCYITPEGKLFYHKKDIEKYLGRELPKQESAEKPETGEKGERAVKNVRDAVPSWPEGDWLPKDWRICFRRLPTALHKCYLPPGERDGFLWHRQCVEEWLAGKEKKLSRMSNSKPMAVIIATAAGSSTSHKRKRSENDVNGDRPHFFGLAPTVSSSSAGAPPRTPVRPPPLSLQETTEECEALRKLLVARGFAEDVELVALVDAPSANPFGGRVAGVYFQLPEKLGSRACYQRLLRVGGTTSAMVCDRVYIIWSSEKVQWQVATAPVDGAPVYAASVGSQETLAEVKGWTICGGRAAGGSFQDCALRVLVPTRKMPLAG